jgi:hypothetical protein
MNKYSQMDIFFFFNFNCYQFSKYYISKFQFSIVQKHWKIKVYIHYVEFGCNHKRNQGLPREKAFPTLLENM